MSDPFHHIESQLAAGGVDAALEALCEELKQAQKYHELFDARLMQTRRRLDLPLVSSADLEELPENVRDQVEEGYLAACREVGELYLQDSQIRQAWMYLRPVGDTAAMREKLASIEPDDENLDELIEVALHEGIDVERGFGLVVSRYGTCNAITTFESAMHGRKKSDQVLAASLLVRTLHAELLANLQADLFGDKEGNVPPDAPGTLAELVAGRESMFGEYTTHIDISHLGAVVRFARIIEDPAVLRLALDLTEYGRCLHPSLQPQGDEPFADGFASYRLFFAAQLGERVEEAVAYFKKKAESANVYEEGTAAVEVYIVLLARLGRHDEAIDAVIRLIPQGTHTTGFAPSLLELSRAAGDYGRLASESRQRGDLLSFAVGRMEESITEEGREGRLVPRQQ